MTSYWLRTDPREPPGTGVVLNWLNGDAASNVRLRLDPAPTVDASPAASGLVRFAGGVLTADRMEARETADDGWTRDIELSMSVGALTALGGTAPLLGFLTGDHWTLTPRSDPIDRIKVRRGSADAVCLLSGGLDSLVGAIDLLAGDTHRRVLLVGFDDSEQSLNRQQKIYAELRRRYPSRVSYFSAELASPHTEPTTRSRSLMFIALGLAHAAAIGDDVPVYVPENGLVGLNVPLIGTRSGSASTRTTHPYFMAGLERLVGAVGVSNRIINPLRLATKGEALADCLDQAALGALARESISCAHLASVRWRGGRLQQCGYCWPCLVRRASMKVIGLDDGADYKLDVLTDRTLLPAEGEPAVSLSALLARIRRGSDPTDALANGPVPGGEATAFASVYQRGMAELEDWLRGSSVPELLAWLP